MGRMKLVRILGLVTLIGMPLLAILLAWIFNLDYNLKQWFLPENFWKQLLIGLVYGLIIAIIASWITERKFMTKVKSKYSRLLGNLNLSWFDVFFLSVCAGIGEEILFRFALQRLTGVWIAAIIFVAIHGYLNYKDRALCVYGVFMVIASAGFGYLTLKLGLLSAMVAHITVDVYLLVQVKLEQKSLELQNIKNDSDPEY